MEKMSKNAQKSLKPTKIAVFRLLVNKELIEIKRNTGNQKLILKKWK